MDLLENNYQVAISVQFLQTAQHLLEELKRHKVPAVTITGADTAALREDVRKHFQSGQAKVVIFTITEGISLHAGQTEHGGNDVPRALILHDPRWSGIQTIQIEGRTHRNGRNAIAYHGYAKDTVEADVVRKTISRISDMKTLLGDHSDLEELTDLLDDLSV